MDPLVSGKGGSGKGGGLGGVDAVSATTEGVDLDASGFGEGEGSTGGTASFRRRNSS